MITNTVYVLGITLNGATVYHTNPNGTIMQVTERYLDALEAITSLYETHTKATHIWIEKRETICTNYKVIKS